VNLTLAHPNVSTVEYGRVGDINVSYIEWKREKKLKRSSSKIIISFRFGFSTWRPRLKQGAYVTVVPIALREEEHDLTLKHTLQLVLVQPLSTFFASLLSLGIYT